MKTLFPDQQATIDDIEAAWAKGHQRPLAQKPTGTGKTVIFTAMAKKYACKGERVLVIVDAEELVEQTMRTMAEDMPGIHVGVVQAGRNHTLAQVIVASKQTLDKPRRRAAIGRFNKIIIDECHMAAAQGYIDIVHALGGFDPTSGVKVIGFTATADRADDLALGDMFEVVAHNQPVEEAFRLGRLVRPDIRQIRLNSADPQARVDAVLREVGYEIQGAYFAKTVKEAHQIRDAFRRAGTTAEVVFDDIKKPERERIYRLTHTNQNKWLVNVNVLVKGFDEPQLGCTVFGRKMQQVQYVQAGGRSLRTFKGSAYAPPKTKAIWLDFHGHTHSLQVQPNLSKSVEGKREKAMAQAAARKDQPVRKAPTVSYAVHLRKPRFGRKHVLVQRIEKTGTYTVAKIHGHPSHVLMAMAKEAVKADQDQRASVLREKIAALGGMV